MGLNSNAANIFGQNSPDVNDVQYGNTGYGYGAAQKQAQQSIAGGQQGLLHASQLYASAAAGAQPSVAQQQLQQGQQAAALQANQMAASARGGAGAGIMAQHQAMAQQAAGAQQANAQSGILRAQEMEQARAGLANTAAQQQQLGQQYGLGRQGQNIQEQGLELQAQQGTQQAQSANDQAALKGNQGLLGGIFGAI
jgi:hypothetical protein